MNKGIFPTDQEIIEAAKISISALKAASILGIQYGTYRKHAIRLGVFSKNQAGKGMNKPSSQKIPLNEILNGLHPQYQSNKLRKRILKDEIKPHECEICKLKEWLNSPIPLELDHIDGNKYNHVLTNLRLICPNCHTTTDNYKGKNKWLR